MGSVCCGDSSKTSPSATPPNNNNNNSNSTPQAAAAAFVTEGSHARATRANNNNNDILSFVAHSQRFTATGAVVGATPVSASTTNNIKNDNKLAPKKQQPRRRERLRQQREKEEERQAKLIMRRIDDLVRRAAAADQEGEEVGSNNHTQIPPVAEEGVRVKSQQNQQKDDGEEEGVHEHEDVGTSPTAAAAGFIGFRSPTPYVPTSAAVNHGARRTTYQPHQLQQLPIAAAAQENTPPPPTPGSLYTPGASRCLTPEAAVCSGIHHQQQHNHTHFGSVDSTADSNSSIVREELTTTATSSLPRMALYESLDGLIGERRHSSSVHGGTDSSSTATTATSCSADNHNTAACGARIMVSDLQRQHQHSQQQQGLRRGLSPSSPAIFSRTPTYGSTPDLLPPPHTTTATATATTTVSTANSFCCSSASLPMLYHRGSPPYLQQSPHLHQRPQSTTPPALSISQLQQQLQLSSNQQPLLAMATYTPDSQHSTTPSCSLNPRGHSSHSTSLGGGGGGGRPPLTPHLSPGAGHLHHSTSQPLLNNHPLDLSRLSIPSTSLLEAGASYQSGNNNSGPSLSMTELSWIVTTPTTNAISINNNNPLRVPI